MEKSGKILWLLGLGFTLFGFLSKIFFHETIAEGGHQITRFSTSLPSYFYVTGLSLFFLIIKWRSPRLVILLVCLVSILFEIYQYSEVRVLDWPDIVASLLGAFTALIIYNSLDNETVIND